MSAANPSGEGLARVNEMEPEKSESPIAVRIEALRTLERLERVSAESLECPVDIGSVWYGWYISKQWRTGTHHCVCALIDLYLILPLTFWINLIT